VSDLCYEHSRDRFWIVSDRARRLFLYDWHRNAVIQSALLPMDAGVSCGGPPASPKVWPSARKGAVFMW